MPKSSCYKLSPIPRKKSSPNFKFPKIKAAPAKASAPKPVPPPQERVPLRLQKNGFALLSVKNTLDFICDTCYD